MPHRFKPGGFVHPSAVSLALLAAAVISPNFALAAEHADSASPLRVGIIGLDTSHVIEFTKILNSPKAAEDVAGARVVAAFEGGSDIPASRNRRAKFTEEIKAMGIEIVDSIPALLHKVDVVMLESVDGRQHLEQVRPVFKAGKPVFIDKPFAGSLVDALTIADLGERTKTPWFTSSSLRFSPGTQAARNDPKIGKITGCDAWGPCTLEPTHPDLYWYGIHGVETLYMIMGTGCETVSRTHTDGTDIAVGVWSGGRVGTFRGLRDGKLDYGAVVFGTKGIAEVGHYEGYRPLVVEIVKFFKTRQPPVLAQETIEMMTFMEAADESKREGGKPVKMADVLAKARDQAKSRE